MTNANERVAYHVGKQLPHSGLSIVVFQHTRRAFILQLRQIISLLIHYTEYNPHLSSDQYHIADRSNVNDHIWIALYM